MQPADRKFPKAGKQVFDSIEISMQRQTGMRLLVVNCIVLLFSNLPAQPLTLSLDEMFRLADQHSKSIRLHDLAIREAEQGVRIAKNARLPSIQAQLDLNYIGDGVMTDRNFSNGIHADMPHFGNTFVLKASQVIYAGGAINRNINRSKLQQKEAELEYVRNRQDIRFMLTGYYLELFRLTVEKRDEAEWIREIPLTPSVRLADVKIEQEKNRIELLRAEKRPRISLHAANDLNGPILIEVPPLNNNFSYWYAGVGISYNLDALFKNGKKLKQARLSALKMEEARKLAVEETGNSIHEAYVNLNEAYIRLRTQKKSVQLAHENFNIVRQRYVNGLALITDMLDASNTQLDMELQLANYQIGILYQYYLLKKLTGNL